MAKRKKAKRKARGIYLNAEDAKKLRKAIRLILKLHRELKAQ